MARKRALTSLHADNNKRKDLPWRTIGRRGNIKLILTTHWTKGIKGELFPIFPSLLPLIELEIVGKNRDRDRYGENAAKPPNAWNGMDAS